jgi:hypothetical protein
MHGFRAFHSVWRTLQDIETVNIIRKGQVRWLPKRDIAAQVAFISSLFGPLKMADRPNLGASSHSNIQSFNTVLCKCRVFQNEATLGNSRIHLDGVEGAVRLLSSPACMRSCMAFSNCFWCSVSGA